MPIRHNPDCSECTCVYFDLLLQAFSFSHLSIFLLYETELLPICFKSFIYIQSLTRVTCSNINLYFHTYVTGQYDSLAHSTETWFESSSPCILYSKSSWISQWACDSACCVARVVGYCCPSIPAKMTSFFSSLSLHFLMKKPLNRQSFPKRLVCVADWCISNNVTMKYWLNALELLRPLEIVSRVSKCYIINIIWRIVVLTNVISFFAWDFMNKMIMSHVNVSLIENSNLI